MAIDMKSVQLAEQALAQPDAEAFFTEFLAQGGDPALVAEARNKVRIAHQTGVPASLPSPPVAPCAAPPAVPGVISINGFESLKKLGQGGMGTVYKAKQLSPCRVVALKVLEENAGRLLARFRTESDAMARLNHPKIVQIFDASLYTSPAFLVMEYCDGGTLADRLTGKPMPPQGAAWIVKELSGAVQFAHEQGVIHRDLKPQNVLLQGTAPKAVAEAGLPGQETTTDRASAPTPRPSAPTPSDDEWQNLNLKVADFGVAHIRDKPGQTRTGETIGTPSYMAPEQADGRSKEVGAASDVYALGVILYECLTGRPPFNGNSMAETMSKVLREAPVSPRRMQPTTPAELETICLKCLEKEPKNRYPTAKALAEDLRRYLAGEPILAKPPGWVNQCVKWMKRKPSKATAIVFAILLAVAAIAGRAWYANVKGEQEAEVASRNAGAREKILVALKEVEKKDSEGWNHEQQPEQWATCLHEAESSISRAKEILNEGDQPEELRRQVDDIEAILHESRRMQMLSAKLDEILMRSIDPTVANEEIAKAYRQRFQSEGIAFARGKERESAETLRKHRLRARLLDALEDWGLRAADNNEKAMVTAAWIALRAEEAVKNDADAMGLLEREIHKKGYAVVLEADQAKHFDRLGPRTVFSLARRASWREPSVAVAILKRAVFRHQKDFWINYHLGVLILRDKNIIHGNSGTEALAYLKTAITQRESAHVHFVLAYAWRVNGNKTEAIGSCNKAIELDSNDLRSYNLLGLVLQEVGRGQEAVEWIQKAINRDDKLADSHHNLGIVLHEQGRLKDAEKAYRKAIKLDKSRADSYASLAALLHDQDPESAETESVCREAIRLNPKSASLYNTLGNILSDKGNPVAGEAEFRKAIQLKDPFPEAHFSLGVALADQKRWGDAEVEYKIAIRQRPNYSAAHLNLGNALHEQLRWDDAEQAYKSAQNLNRTDRFPPNNLGIIYSDQGKWEEAEVNYRRATVLDPQYAYAHYARGRALLQLGQLDEAVVSAKRGHDLGTKMKNWTFPSAQFLQQCERCRNLTAKVSLVLEGKARPADPQEHLYLAFVCQKVNRRYLSGARWYADAFKGDARLPSNVRDAWRLQAASCAVLATAKKGDDSEPIDEAARSWLHGQARQWLTSDLIVLKTMAAGPNPSDRTFAQRRLQHMLSLPDLATVRDVKLLAALPENDRLAWKDLWDEVDALLKDVRRSREQGMPLVLERPLQVAMHGLAGKDKLAIHLVPRGWRTEGVFAELKGLGEIRLPELPVSWYVLEFELEIHTRDSALFLQVGQPQSGIKLEIGPGRDGGTGKHRIPFKLVNVRPVVVWWKGERFFDVGERLTFKLVVGDRGGRLFHKEQEILECDAWPADFAFRVVSQANCHATIYRCSFRPVEAKDLVKLPGWVLPLPGSRLREDKTAERLKSLLTGLESRPKEKTAFVPDTTGLPLAWIPPGEFVMGSRDAKRQEAECKHRVRITRGFWMGRFEVTQGEWVAVMGSNPSRVKGSRYLPVDWVSWEDARRFCSRLTELERKMDRIPAGYVYRLPTEAEWEYACRAGSEQDFSTADFWHRDNTDRVHEVGEKPPNPWGLYDMHGNAWEWTLDRWHNYPKEGTGTQIDPIDQSPNANIVVRGGAWFWRGRDGCRSSARERNHPGPCRYCGFRIVLAPELNIK